MKDQHYHLPVFPIPVFLLPEGMTRLRIFEPRYLKMVSIAMKDQGFIIYCNTKQTKLNENTNVTIWGSWVEIINFNQGEDGILEIDVKCKSLVNIHTLNKQKDNLFYADITNLAHWSADKHHTLNNENDELTQSLQKLIKTSKLLNELYPEIVKDNTVWVVSRWLELLPLEKTIKPIFIQQYNFEQAKEFLNSILQQ
jgi:hypothetical protein